MVEKFFIVAHEEILKLLIAEDVDFILIGGHTVMYYGYMRSTGDMDIFLNPSGTNKANVIRALRNYGIEEEGLNYIESLDFNDAAMFSLFEEPSKIDFLTKINLVTYKEAFSMKIIANIDSLQINILHLDHLILSKINTGRKKDNADIEELQKIQQIKNTK